MIIPEISTFPSIEEAPETSDLVFKVINAGTNRGEDKLIASNGFEYAVKKMFTNSINWR